MKRVVTQSNELLATARRVYLLVQRVGSPVKITRPRAHSDFLKLGQLPDPYEVGSLELGLGYNLISNQAISFKKLIFRKSPLYIFIPSFYA